MQNHIIDEEVFENIDFHTKALKKGIYENCQFKMCNFENADLSGFQFVDCRFEACNLSLSKLNGSLLRDIFFKDCKMLGLNFDACNAFGLALKFQHCVLTHSSFHKTKCRKNNFSDTQLIEVDFSQADFAGSMFDQCNLENAKFEDTILDKCDFSTAFNYTIDPDKNRLKKAKFSSPGLAGLLSKYDLVILD